MNRREEILRTLRDYPISAAASDALAEKTMDDARLAARTTVAAWLSEDKELSLNAEMFLRSIEDLAIAPLLEVAAPEDPTTAAAYLDLLAEQELALRVKVLARIDCMLDDHRPIPVVISPGPRPEELPKPHRVCDVAFIAMRSLVHFGQDKLEQYDRRDDYLALSPDARDEVIRAARRNDTWRRALERETEDGSRDDEHGIEPGDELP